MKYLTTILLLISVTIFAQNKITGKQIIQNVYDRDTGTEVEGQLKMTLTNKSGNQRVRELKQYIKDFGDVEKKIMYFIKPADVKNTSFMNWSYSDDKASNKADDQWIYLPALKKVKRISSDSKSDYFMGSDFTYDDLGDRKPSDDVHKLLREEKLNGEDCYVVESTPKEEDYMYSKTITWIVKDKWIGLQKKFYDEDEDFLKTLSIKKYKEIDGIITMLKTTMENDQNKHGTTMEFSEVKINKGVKDNLFSERMMKRGMK
ncbi:MAG: outer membrane lipoprotein-sorting protein [Candidatus Delongbacteria bacterium]|jgi:outer membrane lipoprotein-sorting protein|nr:outer membrane lipoprotein-sorting protein [Candidatus Delongbacteria bacterium]